MFNFQNHHRRGLQNHHFQNHPHMQHSDTNKSHETLEFIIYREKKNKKNNHSKG